VPALIFVCVARDGNSPAALASPATLVKLVQHLGVGAVRMATSVAHSGLADGSTAYPAVQNILLAARALGVGAGVTTQHFSSLASSGRHRPAFQRDAGRRDRSATPWQVRLVTRPSPRAVSWDRYARDWNRPRRWLAGWDRLRRLAAAEHGPRARDPRSSG
jgi:nitroreductase